MDGCKFIHLIFEVVYWPGKKFEVFKIWKWWQLCWCWERASTSTSRDESLTSRVKKHGADWLIWEKNPPAASHMVGVWERQIRSTRDMLSRCVLTHGSVDTIYQVEVGDNYRWSDLGVYRYNLQLYFCGTWIKLQQILIQVLFPYVFVNYF